MRIIWSQSSAIRLKNYRLLRNIWTWFSIKIHKKWHNNLKVFRTLQPRKPRPVQALSWTIAWQSVQADILVCLVFRQRFVTSYRLKRRKVITPCLDKVTAVSATQEEHVDNLRKLIESADRFNSEFTDGESVISAKKLNSLGFSVKSIDQSNGQLCEHGDRTMRPMLAY